jgi:type III restriction enzyme
MVKQRSHGNGDVPLKLASRISENVSALWNSGEFLHNVTSITQDLLKFWDPEGVFSYERNINFHEGQWQSILNVIYTHEILKVKNVRDLYIHNYPELLSEIDQQDIRKDKHEHPKYCVKMATGTGKTWVMEALLIWQYLNAKHSGSNIFSRNYLIVAPGLIVYQRLLEAFLGKRSDDGTRDFDHSDFKRYESLLIPPEYKDEIFGFIKGCVAQKDEIGRKVTGEGIIAITNWHLLVEDEEEVVPEYSSVDRPDLTLKEWLPITPGTSQGHSLEELDSKYFRGNELAYLVNLPDLVAFNDEAHHLGDTNRSDESAEKRWQEALNKISEGKGAKFIQVDFSATPFSVAGSGNKQVRNYFPHIVSNFEIVDAIKKGLVKTVAIDRRKDFGALPLEFKAERDNGKVTSLSPGQKEMIRAGIAKQRLLEDQFSKYDKTKYPKMLIVCEDHWVVPLVISFLHQEGYSEDEVLEIHSDKKGSVSEDEWKRIERKLFNLDMHENPKLIVSVLMLREGFDVNNICVIVPLRTSSSPILLEQLIGRGLRIMWRGSQYYEEMRKRNIENLIVKKTSPESYIDILSVIEHPNFIRYYNEQLMGAYGEITQEMDKSKVMGGLIKVGLKSDYKDFDLFWIVIRKEKEEEISVSNLSYDKMEPFSSGFKELKPLLRNSGDTFYSQELTVRTTFGEYTVKPDIFNARSYNSFIQKIVSAVSVIHVNTHGNRVKDFPTVQVNSFDIARLVDQYIRRRLFLSEFDPLEDNNWRILLIAEKHIVEHVVRNIAKQVYDSMQNVKTEDAVVFKKYFSDVPEVVMRENYALDVSKCIYGKVAFPSNKGGYEKEFIEFIDADSDVKSFIKINEYAHDFARITYVGRNGLLASYHPDFLIRACNKIYLVETKAEKDISSDEVRSKRLSALDWIAKVNDLKPEDRMNVEWVYVLLGEETFQRLRENGANICEILEYARLTKGKVEGTLGDYMEGNY